VTFPSFPAYGDNTLLNRPDRLLNKLAQLINTNIMHEVAGY